VWQLKQITVNQDINAALKSSGYIYNVLCNFVHANYQYNINYVCWTLCLWCFPSFNWCKHSTCSGGGYHQLQLALVVLFHPATGANTANASGQIALCTVV